MDLAPFIEHFWLAAWQLPPGVAHVQRTLPSPCIHVVFDSGRSGVFGVMTGAFEYTLRDSGRILGTRFRPGAFRGFLGRPVRSITDRELPLSSLLRCDDAEAERCVLGAADDAGMMEELGYYDQSPFTTDFEKLVGKPPADYRRSRKTP